MVVGRFGDEGGEDGAPRTPQDPPRPSGPAGPPALPAAAGTPRSRIGSHRQASDNTIGYPLLCRVLPCCTRGEPITRGDIRSCWVLHRDSGRSGPAAAGVGRAGSVVSGGVVAVARRWGRGRAGEPGRPESARIGQLDSPPRHGLTGPANPRAITMTPGGRLPAVRTHRPSIVMAWRSALGTPADPSTTHTSVTKGRLGADLPGVVLPIRPVRRAGSGGWFRWGCSGQWWLGRHTGSAGR